MPLSNLSPTANKSMATIISLLFSSLVCLAWLNYFPKPGFAVFDYLQQKNQIIESPEIVVVEVDQESLNRFAEESVVFPFPRQIFGAVAEMAAEAEAKALVFDILFTEDSSYGAEDDQLFADMLKLAKIPTFFPSPSLYGSVKPPIPLLLQRAEKLGAVDLPMDSDGVFRRVPDFLPNIENSQQTAPEFSLHEPARVTLPSAVFRKITGNSKEHKKNIMNTYKREAFTRLSLYDLIRLYRNKSEGESVKSDLENYKNKVWIVGYTAPGLFDLRPMADNKKSPGVYIIATALANRMQNQGILPAPKSAVFLLSLIFVIFVVIAVNKSKEPIRAGLFITGFTFISGIVGCFIGISQSYWMDPVAISISVLGGGAVQMIWNLRTIWNERLKLASTLKNSMSKEMLDLIKRGEVSVSRFGEERKITILFSDLAGYTGLSESSTPKQIVEILNHYLDRVVEHIFKHDGYVDKFIGDAVMVLWGAPLQQSDHAKKALAAAEKFQDVCDEFNRTEKIKNPEYKKLQTRVGVHTGSAVVGNIGARNRFNYTAIGDAVNMASRLEGVGKYYDLNLIISEDTVNDAEALNREDILEVDRIILKGKSEPIRIFTIVNQASLPAAKEYRIALNFYYAADWKSAIEYFDKADVIPAAKIMSERCRQALQSRPAPNYVEGAWAHDNK